MTGLDSFAQSLCLSEHKQMFDYWRTVAPPQGLPGRQHIDPLNIPTLLLPWILLVDVIRQENKRRFRFRLVGTGNVSRYGRDSTGQWFEEVYSGEILEQQIATYDRVASSGTPEFSHNTLPITGQEFTTYNRLLLPFANDGETVNMIMGVTVFDDTDSLQGVSQKS